MYNHISIILVVIATIINSIVFGYIACNSNKNKTNNAYLIFLTFIVLYIIFDCVIIQTFSSKDSKDIIVKIQALFWMPLSALFLNFIYLFLKKQKNEIFYFFITSTITAIFITLFSNKVLIGYKSFNLGTEGITGPWFLPVTFIGILPAAAYALYLIGREGKVFNYNKEQTKITDAPLLALQLKILFFGSITCLIIAVSTNIIFDEILGYGGKPHLASLSLSIQSIFLLPALIKYNFLNKPIDKLGDELYANSSDAVVITNSEGIILNLNRSARSLFKLKGKINKKNIEDFFKLDNNKFFDNENYTAETKQGHHVSITQSNISKRKQSLGKILVIRDISKRIEAEENLHKSEKAYRHVIESSSDIIYNTDVNGIVTYINPVFEKLSGYKEKEVIGTDINKLVVSEFQQKIKDIYLKFFNSPEDNITLELPCKKKNGKIIWLELNTSKINAENKVIEFSTISRDITERKKTEYNLKESEERYRLLVENSTEMIYKTDMYGNYTFVNQVFIKNSDMTEAKILKSNCFDRVIEEHRKEVKIFYAKQYENKELISYYELPCKVAKNKTIWVGQISRLELDEFDTPIGYSITARDITDRKMTEEKLLQITKELTLAQNVAGLGSFNYDVKKDVVTWSDKLYKIYGKDKKTFIPSRESFFSEIVHPDSKQLIIDKVDEAVNNKLTDFDYIHKTKAPNDKEKWFQAIIKIKYDENNEVILMNGTSQDITELYLIRLDLEKSELRLQKAQEIAKLGFWEENHKTGEIYWSNILKNMFGIKEDRVINKGKFWEIVHSEDLKWMNTNWNKAEKEKTPYSGTFRVKLKNGEVKHLMEQAEFINDSKGKLIKTVGTVIDVTELHKYQEELRQLSSHIQKAQEEERAHIAGEIHDELGQRLTSMTMDLAFLKSKINKDTPDEITECLSALTSQAEGTIQIIRKISQELRPSILDDLGLISAIDWLKEQYNKRTEIHFTMDLPDENVNINGEHATAVFRITQEALTNIMRHSKANNVTIKMELKNSEILLKVKDDGKGIVNNNIKNSKTFGVFSMKERASSLGGKLDIRNNIGKGTTVNLILPYNQLKKA